MLKEIERLVKEEIRPYLNQHGGDLEVTGFQDGIVYVNLTGACAACMMADETTEQVIKKVLTQLDGVNDVSLERCASRELLEFATDFLKKGVGRT